MALNWRAITLDALRAAVRTGTSRLAPRRPTSSRPTSSRPASPRGRRAAPAARRDYPGDFGGTARLEYSPKDDGQPDPGEVVWTWVPYEEDHHRGKDRPVLVVARDGSWLLGLMLSSKDHDGPGSDERDEARHGRRWLDLGSGPWDVQGRPSQVRTDRVVRVDPDAVRREGARLDAARFEHVAVALRTQHGWD